MPMVRTQDLGCESCSSGVGYVTHTNTSTKNLEAIKAALDVATPISGPLAPVVAGVGLSVMFGKWLSDMYHSTYVSYFHLILSAHFRFQQSRRPPVPDGLHRRRHYRARGPVLV
jgi:hypothetical protein